MRPITTILVPLDFSEASHTALRYACQLADRLQASLHVLHVVRLSAMPSGYVELYVATPDVQERFEADGHQLLDQTCHVLLAIGARSEIPAARNGRGFVEQLFRQKQIS